jgi:hypothetical protein
MRQAEAESRGQEVEALTRQPASEQDTSATAAKATAMAMAMATGNATRRHHGYLAATALVLPAEAAATLIADDADGGNSGIPIVGRASLTAGNGLIINFIVYLLSTL